MTQPMLVVSNIVRATAKNRRRIEILLEMPCSPIPEKGVGVIVRARKNERYLWLVTQ